MCTLSSFIFIKSLTVLTIFLLIQLHSSFEISIPSISASPKCAASRSFFRRSSVWSLHMGFFEDLFKDAFANDERLLSDDKQTGQLDYDGEDSDDGFGKTDVQKRWLESQQQFQQKQRQNTMEKSSVSANTRSSMGGGDLSILRGAPIDPKLLVGTDWILNLYLVGVPDRDPSNNLSGSRMRITSQDPSLALGAVLPEEPNVSLTVHFDENGVCRTGSSEFTSGEVVGEYKLSPDNRFIRFSMDTVGYRRVITTTGTITKVYWTDTEDSVSKTQSTYSIPAGLVYADAAIGYGEPGQLKMGNGDKSELGYLRLEQKFGLLGAATRMTTCGKFSAKMIKKE